ncbi:antigen B [Listeria monocytogenes]|nr:antigen B [Listeria monocytogenes]
MDCKTVFFFPGSLAFFFLLINHLDHRCRHFHLVTHYNRNI